MQRASELTASVLFFVHGLTKDDLQQKCDIIFEKKKGQKRKFNTFIGIAIDSYPKGHVVGATVDCAKDILELSTEKVKLTFNCFFTSPHLKQDALRALVSADLDQ